LKKLLFKNVIFIYYIAKIMHYFKSQDYLFLLQTIFKIIFFKYKQYAYKKI